jgi:WD40 repeat protein
VYALGVLLHELLSGELPVEVRGASLTEAARRVREQAPAPLAALPADTERAMASDLGIIAQRALEKEPAARYASAGELAADLRRCLRHEPILARPPSAMYLLRRFVRRRRAMAVGVAVAGAMVLAAGLVAAVQYASAERARVLASEQRDNAERGQYRVALFAASSSQRTGNASGARRALAETPAALRGWEWEYLSSSMRVGEVVALPTLAERLHVPATGELVLIEARDAARRSFLLHVPSRRVVGEVPLREGQMLGGQEAVLVAGEGNAGRVECYAVPTGGGAARLVWSRPAAERAQVFAFEADKLGRWEPGFVVLDGTEVAWVDADDGRERLRVAQSGRTREAEVFEPAGGGQLLEFELAVTDGGVGNERHVLRQLDFVSGRLATVERRTPASSLRVWYSGPQRWYLSRDYEAALATLHSRPDAMWSTCAVSERANSGGETLVAMTDTRGAVRVSAPVARAPVGGRARETLLASDSIVRRLAFTQDGRELLGIDASGVLQVLPPQRARDPWRSVAEEHDVPGTVSLDGARAVSVSWGSATMLDTLTGLVMWRTNFGREQPVASAICPQTGMVACFMGRAGSHEAFLLDGTTGAVLRALGERAWLPDPRSSVGPAAPWTRSVRDAVFLPDGKTLALLHEDGALGVLEIASLGYRVVSPAPADASFGRDLALSRDGAMLAVVATRGGAARMDAAPIRVLRTRDMGVMGEVDAGAALCAAFTPDGGSLLAGRADGSLCSFAVAAGGSWARRWCAPPTADEWLSSIAVSPDGSRIAAAGVSPSIRIFDGMGNHMTSLATVVPFSEPRVFTQDGALVASGIGVHSLRFDTRDVRAPDSWTRAAIEAWPAEVPRPASVAEARLLVQRVDEAARSVSRLVGTFADRERAAVLALPGGERDAAAPLLRVWLRRVGFHANWSNSDAILTTQHTATSEAELRSVVAMLDELREHRPLRDGFAMNAMSALAKLGELEAGIERLARVDAAWERAGLVPEARRELHVLRALAERPGAAAAAMARVPRVQASIDAVGDEQARAGLAAELAAIVAGLGGSR